MKKTLASLFDAARAWLNGANVPHNGNLRANRFEDRRRFSVWISVM